MYPKTRDGLIRALAVQRLIHNWLRPHGAHGEQFIRAQILDSLLLPSTSNKSSA